MKVAELLVKLADFPPDADVYVWEGYDAGIMTTEIAVNYDGDVILEAK
ncbi:hypothetical protein [Paenibacillus xylanilyticus]